MKPELTQVRVKELFNYDPKTGILTNRFTRQYNVVKDAEAGSYDVYGYRQVNYLGSTYKVHRIIWLYVYGKYPTEGIDHIDHNRSNNKITNLRAVTQLDNCHNVSITERNTSGTVGVYWIKNHQKWRASINHNGKYIHLGYFFKKTDAIDARQTAEKRFGFHFNHGKTMTLPIKKQN